MILYVSPQVLVQLMSGKEGVPKELNAWSRKYVRQHGATPSIPVIIDFHATPDFWRLIDDEGMTVVASMSTEENLKDQA